MAAQHEAETLHTSPSEALLFVLTCILIGISTKYFLHRIKIPYTALLLVFGLCIGLLQAAAPKTDAFTATLKLWMGIDPHLLLLIFLPTIGFSAALGQEPHLLRKNWGQILILAWPGVVVTFLLIGLCGRFFFPYGWTWPQCLLFGAMLSATDPVAVVAVLHEVGADEKLSSVIDGESLVNDGSALVIFLVLQQFVQGASLSAGQIVVLFLRLALLGAALGLVFGLLTSFWLANIWNDPCLEIVLTLGAAYACYFVSEELAGASGLLAVVVMGFSMSLMGGRHITSRIKVEMHAFWNVLEWLANTILFIWVGIALGFVLLEPQNPALRIQEIKFAHHLSASDAGYAVVLYLWLLVARAASIFLFYPLLSTGRVGYAMTWRTAVFMVWAGLRGAVGVAMSLFVLLDPLIASDEFKAHCVFYMALMAFATVLINGSTCKYVLQGLGLLSMTQQQLDVLQHVLQEVDSVPDAVLEHCHTDPVLGAPDPLLVKRWSSVAAATGMTPGHTRVLKRLLTMQSGRANSQSPGTAKVESALAAAQQDQSPARKLPEYRARLLHIVKASYGDMYQHFELTTPGIKLLQEVTDVALDAASSSTEHTTSAALGSKHSRQPPLHQQQRQQEHQGAAASAGKAVAETETDPERGAVSNGLTDWQELCKRLEAQGWTGRLGAAVGCCGLGQLGAVMSQREVAAKLQLVSAFVAAHGTAQEVFAAHLKGAGAAAAADGTAADGTAADGTAADGTAADGGSGGDAAGGDDSSDACLADRVLSESRGEVDAALAYAHEVLLPMHPGLAKLLMSRHVSIQVLQRQADFLDSIEESGLVRAEEVHNVQHKVATRLERLQHQRTWNILHISQQQQQPAEGKAGGMASSAFFSSRPIGSSPSSVVQAGGDATAAATAAAAASAAGAGTHTQSQQQQQAADAAAVPAADDVTLLGSFSERRQQQQVGQAGSVSADRRGLLFTDLTLVRASMKQRSYRPR